MQRILSLRYYVYAVFLGMALLPLPCHAERLGYDAITYERFKPNTFEQGMRAGNFIIRPQITLEDTYDNNIYRSKNNTKSDMIFQAKPILAVDSNWKNHALNLKLGSDIGRYMNKSSENYEDVLAEASGRLDITRNNYLSGSTSYLHNHADRGIPTDTSSVSPITYNQYNNRVSATHAATRLSGTLGGEVRKTDYEDNRTVGGAFINESIYNYKQYVTDFQLGYELSKGYQLYARPSANRITYDSTVMATNHDSKGYTFDVGTTFDTGKLKGDWYVGLLKQEYDGPAFKSASTWDYGGAVYWQATGLTGVTLGGLRSVQQTNLADSPYVLASFLRLNVQHQLLRDAILTGEITYRNNDYAEINRTDSVTEVVIGGRYYLNDYVATKLNLDYLKQNSNAVGGSYNDSRVTFGLVFGI